jgi:hypothetical protein
MILARFFYWLFKSQIKKIQFSEQSKKIGFEKLAFVFTDSNGKDYYRYTNDLEIPILRKGELERVLLEVESGLSGNELGRIIDAIDAAINEKDKKGMMSPNIGKIGFLIQEIRNRKEILIHPELLFEAVAILYIREDEDPAIVDREILKEKIEQLKKDSVEGLYDFFYTSGLSTYIPFLEKSPEEWMEYYEAGKAKLEGMKKFLSTSEQESLTI